MNCIAIDDEPKALSVISGHAKKISSLNLLKTFRSGLDALDFLNREQVDLIFLDINMPDLTGLEFLQALSQPPLVIFTTAFSEYAVQSYEWNAVDYLLKPVEFHRFLKAVNKAASVHQIKQRQYEPGIQGIKQEDDIVLIKSGTQTYQVKSRDILFAEASGNYVYIITGDKKIITLSSLGEVQKLLPAHLFCRIHKSFIISLKHIEIIENHQVRIADFKIPVGRTYREAFLNAFKSG